MTVSNPSWRIIVTLLATLIASLASAQEATTQKRGVDVPGTPFERRTIGDSLGRSVVYYISHPKKRTAPVLLMIQGSGCVAVINEQPPQSFSTVFGLVPFASEGEFTVIAVEKPFSEEKVFGEAGKGSPGGAAQCSAAFNADFTAERWLVALRAALDDARKAPWVDTRRTLVFGMSEGAVMGALLAARDDRVTDVVSIGGSGTTQLFDFIAAAYRRCFDASECIAEVDRNMKAIRANPESSTDFAWGHPHKRWTSFFAVDPGELLVHSKARVYLAFGTADEAVPALSQEVAVAKLQAAGRDVTVRRVPNAGHMLTEGADYEQMDKEFRAGLKWFWEAPAR